MFSFLLYIVYFFTFLYINFQKVLKGMKGEHVIDDTGNVKDTVQQKENVIKLKKTWNGNKNMKPWCLILNFLDFIKQNCIDFGRKLDWFPYKP